MSTFGPRRVSHDSWKLWIRIALDLMTQRWATNAGLVLFAVGALYVLPQRGVFGLIDLVVGPFLLAASCLLAECVDRRVGFLELVASRKQNLLRLARFIFLVTLAFALIATGPLMFVEVSEADRINAASSLGVSVDLTRESFSRGQDVLVISVLWVMTPLTAFMLPMLAAEDIGPMHAFDLADDARLLNPFCWWVCIGAAFLHFVAACIHGTLAVPLIPLVGSTMYAAYRHVFWNQLPEAARRQAKQVATAVAA